MQHERSVENDVIQLFAEELFAKPTELGLEQRLIDDLDVDSLACVELVLALEERFDITIPDDDLARVVTVGDVVNYIQGRLNR